MNIPVYLKPLAEEAMKYNNANKFIESLKKRIHKEELGCIWSKWISLPGLPSMCLGSNNTPDKEVIQKAISQYKRIYDKENIDNELKNKYPNKQLYEGTLPEDDVLFEGNSGMYIYVLKDRRKLGKYLVQEAISIEFKESRSLDLIKFWKETKGSLK